MSSGKKIKAQKVEDNQLQALVDVLESSKTEPLNKCVAKSRRTCTRSSVRFHDRGFVREMTALVDGSLIRKMK
jgi:hypothetical protein